MRRKEEAAGGAWRAYVHYQITHKGESNDLKRLALKYNSLSVDDRHFYEELGRMG